MRISRAASSRVFTIRSMFFWYRNTQSRCGTEPTFDFSG